MLLLFFLLETKMFSQGIGQPARYRDNFLPAHFIKSLQFEGSFKLFVVSRLKKARSNSKPVAPVPKDFPYIHPYPI